MSSSEVLEGKITQVTEKRSLTTRKGKETTVQNIVINTTGYKGSLTERIVKVAIWGHKEDFKDYSGKRVRILGLRENTDGSYAGYYGTEFDDRLDSDPTEEHLTDKDWKNIVDPNVTSIPPETITKIRNSSNQELSKYSITVTRSKDYQSIALSEEFTGSFAEIDEYWIELNEKALFLLLRMPKL